jgi:cell division protein FtsB
MDTEALTKTNEYLLEEVKRLQLENDKLKSQLENYNNSRKSYYEKNKEYVKEKAKESLKKLSEQNPDKIKEYRRTAYLKQKEKKKQQEIENLINGNI